jgi:hypothetical protein
MIGAVARKATMHARTACVATEPNAATSLMIIIYGKIGCGRHTKLKGPFGNNPASVLEAPCLLVCPGKIKPNFSPPRS